MGLKEDVRGVTIIVVGLTSDNSGTLGLSLGMSLGMLITVGVEGLLPCPAGCLGARLGRVEEDCRVRPF